MLRSLVFVFAFSRPCSLFSFLCTLAFPSLDVFILLCVASATFTPHWPSVCILFLNSSLRCARLSSQLFLIWSTPSIVPLGRFSTRHLFTFLPRQQTFLPAPPIRTHCPPSHSFPPRFTRTPQFRPFLFSPPGRPSISSSFRYSPISFPWTTTPAHLFFPACRSRRTRPRTSSSRRTSSSSDSPRGSRSSRC